MRVVSHVCGFPRYEYPWEYRDELETRDLEAAEVRVLPQMRHYQARTRESVLVLGDGLSILRSGECFLGHDERKLIGTLGVSEVATGSKGTERRRDEI